MHYTREEIAGLAVGQLSEPELDQAVEAFEGFAGLFGRAWIESFFRAVQSPAFVSYLSSLWRDWLVVRTLPRASELTGRWAQGIGTAGVEAEVHVIAHLVRESTAVELFPEITTGRVPECRFRVDGEWVYVEVSRRAISEVRQRCERVLASVALAAAYAVSGAHGKVALLREPGTDELQRIINWLRTIHTPEGSTLDDLAFFYADSFESPTSADDVIAQKITGPPEFLTHIADQMTKGTACIGVSDVAAQSALEAEAAQLPRDAPGIIFLDLTSVIGTYRRWSPLIRRRLQPNINTRIGSVVVYERLRGVHGPTKAGEVLLNEHARCPLPDGVTSILMRFVEHQVGG